MVVNDWFYWQFDPISYILKKAVPQLKRLVAGFPPRRPGFDPRSGYVGFVVDKVALGQVFSEYIGFPCQSSFHQLLHNHHHQLSSGAGTISQQWPTYQVDSVSPHPKKLYIEKYEVVVRQKYLHASDIHDRMPNMRVMLMFFN
jgi:hypothetical protein